VRSPNGSPKEAKRSVSLDEPRSSQVESGITATGVVVVVVVVDVVVDEVVTVV